jgi:hypothetical protein
VVHFEFTNNLSQILQGEPEINADGVHEGSSSPQTEIVHGNVSVSASREDSVIHHKIVSGRVARLATGAT